MYSLHRYPYIFSKYMLHIAKDMKCALSVSILDVLFMLNLWPISCSRQD